jgi:parallel beta-helix repeat protein
MKKRMWIAAAATTAAALSVFAQGTLTPPGAPGAMMKTLDQLEPRTDVGTLSGDPSSEVVITNEGSYYLSANLEVSKTYGIVVDASDVTVDLNGFRILRVSGSGGDGIRINTNMHRAAVRNGIVAGFDYGVQCFADGCLFEQLAVSGCEDVAMNVAQGARVLDCRAHSNQGPGIRTGGGSVISGCLAYSNQGHGIEGGVSSTILGCSAWANWGSGVFAGVGSTVADCSARENGEGITTGTACTIRHCSTQYNYHGISVPNACHVLGNNCYDNGGNGIIVGLDRNRIEGNHLIDNNMYGLSVVYPGNIILRNTARGNEVGNYDIVPTNTVGQILDYRAETGGGTVTNANPWANFSF